MLIVVVLVAIEYFCSFACLLFCSWNGFQATPTFPFLYGSFFIYHTLTCYGKYHAKWRHRDFIDGVDWLYLYNLPLPTFRLQFSYFHTTPIFGTLFQFENYQYSLSIQCKNCQLPNNYQQPNVSQILFYPLRATCVCVRYFLFTYYTI